MTFYYRVDRVTPSKRATARRLGLVTSVKWFALVGAVEDPPPHGSLRIVEVPEIRHP